MNGIFKVGLNASECKSILLSDYSQISKPLIIFLDI